MAKAFWTIVAAVGNGTSNNPYRPNLPNLPTLRGSVPCDINRLLPGAAPADHTHLLVGNVGIMSDQAGGGHEHIVINGVTRLRGTATAHVHPDPAGPDFYMCFLRCSDADFTTLVGAPNNVKPLVMVIIDGNGNEGGLDQTLWNNGSPNDWERKTFWDTRALNILGLQLPAEVDKGALLWKILAGMFMARRPASDEGMR